MPSRCRLLVASLFALAVLAGSARAADLTDSLKKGTPDIKQAGALAFAPEGILLVGDSLGAAVFAIDTGERPSSPAEGKLKVEGVNEKIAALLGTEAKQVRINDLAVNPLSGNAYLSVSRGSGSDAQPVILRVLRAGKVEEMPLKDVKFAKATLPNPPAADQRGRQETITSLGYADGKVFVAGLSNEEFASKLRAIPFPFTEADKGASIEIFHGAHGRFETQSPVRTFVPYKIKDDTHLLAAYTCTPLVKVPVADLKPGQKVRGTTIAELGNRNRPLDMVVYQKDGKDYILIANNSRGVMKVTTDDIATIEGITKPVGGGGTAGLKYDTIKDLKGVVQLARLDKDNALVLIDAGGGAMNIDTIALP
jgi:hypothetical protein